MKLQKFTVVWGEGLAVGETAVTFNLLSNQINLIPALITRKKCLDFNKNPSSSEGKNKK